MVDEWTDAHIFCVTFVNVLTCEFVAWISQMPLRNGRIDTFSSDSAFDLINESITPRHFPRLTSVFPRWLALIANNKKIWSQNVLRVERLRSGYWILNTSHMQLVSREFDRIEVFIMTIHHENHVQEKFTMALFMGGATNTPWDQEAWTGSKEVCNKNVRNKQNEGVTHGRRPENSLNAQKGSEELTKGDLCAWGIKERFEEVVLTSVFK